MQPHEVSADMAALSPEACDYVRQLARRLDEAEHLGGHRKIGSALGTGADPDLRRWRGRRRDGDDRLDQRHFSMRRRGQREEGTCRKDGLHGGVLEIRLGKGA